MTLLWGELDNLLLRPWERKFTQGAMLHYKISMLLAASMFFSSQGQLFEDVNGTTLRKSCPTVLVFHQLLTSRSNSSFASVGITQGQVTLSPTSYLYICHGVNLPYSIEEGG